MKLYSFWRSQASYRVRIALHLKGLPYETITIDLLKGDQFDPAYRSLNPEAAVPTLVEDDGRLLVQSVAILEYIEETHPEPPILPASPHDRAHSRAIAAMVAGDVHPLIVPRMRKYLQETLGVGEAARVEWFRHWMGLGSRAVEELLSRDPRTGRFCCGDSPTIADLCLIPHFVSASHLYDLNLGDYPTCQRIFENCMELDAFAATHPMKQPDAPAHH